MAASPPRLLPPKAPRTIQLLHQREIAHQLGNGRNHLHTDQDDPSGPGHLHHHVARVEDVVGSQQDVAGPDAGELDRPAEAGPAS